MDEEEKSMRVVQSELINDDGQAILPACYKFQWKSKVCSNVAKYSKN